MTAIPRSPAPRLLVLAALAAGIASIGCESKKPNASEDVFQSGGADMSQQLDEFAAEPGEEEAPATTPADDTPAEPAPAEPAPDPHDEQPPDLEPIDP